MTNVIPTETNGIPSLLPCPFCGGEAEPFNPFDNADGTWCVLCSECAASTGFEQTEAEAIAAWNARAERTCRNLSKDFAVFHCSVCGYFERDCACANYCPCCGAKVIA